MSLSLVYFCHNLSLSYMHTYFCHSLCLCLSICFCLCLSLFLSYTLKYTILPQPLCMCLSLCVCLLCVSLSLFSLPLPSSPPSFSVSMPHPPTNTHSWTCDRDIETPFGGSSWEGWKWSQICIGCQTSPPAPETSHLSPASTQNAICFSEKARHKALFKWLW